jgi:hypothetical protein
VVLTDRDGVTIEASSEFGSQTLKATPWAGFDELTIWLLKAVVREGISRMSLPGRSE